MKKPQAVILERELDRHPAYRAWRLAGEGGRVPSSIEILKPEKRKSAVYRLNGLGHGTRSVIAKRSPEEALYGELRLYREVLPALPVRSLELYGAVEDLDADGFGWLFLEDAGETWYSGGAPEHRALAAEWLGRLHAGAWPTAAWLPDTGPAYFRSVRGLARDGVRTSLAHAALTVSDRHVLHRILSLLEGVEGRWPWVEDVCARMPRTLVHGDFVAKNVRVRERAGRSELVAFDWETGGVAPPAVDIALLRGTADDRRRYLAVVSETWPELRLPDVERLALIGAIFRLLHEIYWESRSFAYAWVERAMRKMVAYEMQLRAVLTPEEAFRR